MTGSGDTVGGYYDGVDFTGGESSISPPEEQMSADDPNAGNGQSLPVQDCPMKERIPGFKLTARTAIYFDGTGNNRDNAQWRADNPGHDTLSPSWETDFTNVERLERAAVDCRPDYDISANFYVQGMGTVSGEIDDVMGSVAGTGFTGVEQRERNGRRRMTLYVKNEVDSKAQRGAVLSKIDLDTFGFSRGAATARLYVHQAMRGDRGQKVENLLVTVMLGRGTVKFKFAGLYDTVAALGLDTHKDDWAELHLGTVEEEPEYVVHLAAAEEYRLNFSLNPFRREVSGNGFQAFLPGAHSDLGGGYPVDSPEASVRVFDGRFWTSGMKRGRLDEGRWFSESGWFKPGDMQFYRDKFIHAGRANVKGYYIRIPLHIMAKFATDHGVLYTDFGMKARDNKLRPEMESLYSDLLDYCTVVASGWESTRDYWVDRTNAAMADLRYNHLHMSSHYSKIYDGAPGIGKALRPYYAIRNGKAQRWRRIIGPGGVEDDGCPPAPQVTDQDEAADGAGGGE